MIPASILLMDNVDAFRSSMTDFLEKCGYRVVGAATVEDAFRKTEQELVHCALVDIRMEDEDDDDDISGFTFATASEMLYLPKIVLTAYPGQQTQLMTIDFLNRPEHPVLHYRRKSEDPGQILALIESIFATVVRRSESLRILWRDESASFLSMVSHFARPENMGQFALLVDSAEDLCRRLFHRSTSVTLGRPLRARDGIVWVDAVAVDAAGAPSRFVLAIGTRSAIRSDLAGLARNRLAAQAGIAGEPELVETYHLAAAAYALGGIPHDGLRPLADVVRQGPPEEAARAVESLYEQLKDMHSAGRSLGAGPLLDDLWAWKRPGEPAPAAEALRDCVRRLGTRVAQLLPWTVELEGGQLRLRMEASTHETRHPAALALPPAGAPQSWYGSVHGRLGLHSIFLDGELEPVLLDFRAAGRQPLLSDFALLESDLLLADVTTRRLHEALALAAALAASTTLEAPLAPEAVAPGMQPIAAAVLAVRRCAARLLGDQPLPYLMALYVCYVDRLLHSCAEGEAQIDNVAATLLSLYAAGACAQHCLPPAGFSLDRSRREAYVDGRTVVLTEAERDILAYLEDSRGKICTRAEISLHALKSGIADSDAERERVNKAISRLRRKLETNPEAPRYLVTVDTRGYQLNS